MKRELIIVNGLHAFLDLMWYSGQEQHVRYVAQYIKHYKGYCIDSDDYIQKNCRDLWGMLVILFGDYGTSPFSGWIEPEYAVDAIFNLENWLKDYPLESEDDK